ncbi:MAG: Gfo/Idh/MocA family protein, partial [Planctomycetota bacterium]
ADKWYSNTAASGIAAHQDFRELIDRPDIDTVFVAAPENWHGVLGAMAAKAGKDVYGEKALTHTVPEGRALIDVIRNENRVFQSGTQQRSDPKFRKACELAMNGYLGDVRQVHVGVPGGGDRAKPGVWPVAPIPDDLDYNLWLGPAARKPYREDLCSFNWYFVSDYCVGWIVSWGVHHLDIALWGMPAFQRGRIEVGGSAEYFNGTADVAHAWDFNFTTPSGLKLNFVDNAKSHGQGVRFIGDKGWVHVNRGKITASDPALLQVEFKPGDKRLQESIHHHADFFESVLSRQDPVSTIESCHHATTLGVVADIAARLDRELTWDWDRERFVGDKEANSMLSRSLRSPWKIA